jgi:hypothetical protein
MVSKPKAIKVTSDTDWPRLLDEAAASPVRVERNGVVFQLSREPDDARAGYDPERLRDGLRRFAGTLSPEEGERLKEQIYRSRDEGTRPIDRP